MQWEKINRGGKILHNDSNNLSETINMFCVFKYHYILVDYIVTYKCTECLDLPRNMILIPLLNKSYRYTSKCIKLIIDTPNLNSKWI